MLRFEREPKSFSPTAEGAVNRARVGFVLREPTNVTFSVVDSEGAEVRRLVDSRRLPGDEELFFAWNGRDDEGRVVPDGVYRLRVEREGKGRAVTSGRRVRVDTKPAQLAIVSARPRPGARRAATPRRSACASAACAPPTPSLRVLRTGSGRPREWRGSPRMAVAAARWDGRVRGRAAPEGEYVFERESPATGRATSGRSRLRPGPAAAPRWRCGGPRWPRLPAWSRRARRCGAARRAGPARVAVQRPPGGRGRAAARRPRAEPARCGCGSPGTPAPGCTSCASTRAGGPPPPRWRWRACPAGRAARARPLVVLPVITWQGSNPLRRRLRRLPRRPRQPAGALALFRPYAHGGCPWAPAARPRRCSPSSTAPACRTT